jgi:hypothetical protein
MSVPLLGVLKVSRRPVSNLISCPHKYAASANKENKDLQLIIVTGSSEK